MLYEVRLIEEFYKNLKKLNKKFPSLKNELLELISLLKKNPRQGIPLGKDCFKIKISIKSKGRGKSGGARVITCVKINKNKIYLLAIYDKSEKNNISNLELESLYNKVIKM